MLCPPRFPGLEGIYRRLSTYRDNDEEWGPKPKPCLLTACFPAHEVDCSVSGQTKRSRIQLTILGWQKGVCSCTGAFIQRAHILALNRAQLLALTSAIQAGKPSWDEISAIMSTCQWTACIVSSQSGLGAPLDGQLGARCLIAEWLWLCIAGVLTVRSRSCSSGGGRSTSRPAMCRAAMKSSNQRRGKASESDPASARSYGWRLWPWPKSLTDRP